MKTSMNPHGGAASVQNQRERMNGAQIPFLDYSINIHPLPLCSDMKKCLTTTIDQLAAYPEIEGLSSRKHLANHWHIDESHLILGNGAMACIYLYARAFQFQNVMIVSPTFNEYERAFKNEGTGVLHHVWDICGESANQLERLHEAIMATKPSCLVLANPNNPTGHLLTSPQIEKLVNCLALWDGQLLLDESFIELSFGKSMKYLFQEAKYPTNLFIIASLTKFYSIPGLRLGVGIGAPKHILNMQAKQEPWQLNALALTFLNHIELENHRKIATPTWLIEERTHLVEAIQKYEVLQVFPTQTNFILVEMAPDIRGEWLDFMASGDCAIYMRVCDDFVGLEKGRYLRIAIKSQSDNQVFLQKTQQFFQTHSRNEVMKS